jgi:F-box-like
LCSNGSTRPIVLCFAIFCPYGIESVVLKKKNSSQTNESTVGLLDQPDEILLHIFSFLSHRGVARMQQMNRRLKTVAGDSSLWRALCEKDLGFKPKGSDENVKKSYQKTFQHIHYQHFLNHFVSSLNQYYSDYTSRQ